MNFCSVAPSSTSDFRFTASIAVSSGYSNSCTEIGWFLFEARAKIFAFEHAGEAIVGAEADNVDRVHFVEPFAVVADFGFFAVEDFEDLLEIGFRVGVDLLAGQRRARFGNAGGIADHRGEIADQEDRGVAHVLKMFQLAQHHGVAEMKIGRGGVDAEIDAQRLAGFERFRELRFQLFFANDFGGAFFQVRELFVYGFEFGVGSVVDSLLWCCSN